MYTTSHNIYYIFEIMNLCSHCILKCKYSKGTRVLMCPDFVQSIVISSEDARICHSKSKGMLLMACPPTGLK